MSSSTQELHTATTELPSSAAVPTRWLALAVLLAGAFLPILDFTIVNLALPSIRQSLGATSAQVQFVISAYAATYAVMLIHRRASWRPAWTQTNVSDWRGRILRSVSSVWIRSFSNSIDSRAYFAGSYGYSPGPTGPGIYSHPVPWSGTNAGPGVIWSNVRV